MYIIFIIHKEKNNTYLSSYVLATIYLGDSSERRFSMINIIDPSVNTKKKSIIKKRNKTFTSKQVPQRLLIVLAKENQIIYLLLKSVKSFICCI